MTDKSRKSTFGRRVFVSAALIALLGVFFALYFLIYIPQQQVAYNKSAFRVLNEIAGNFRERLDNESLKSLQKNNVPQKKYDLFLPEDTIYNAARIGKKLAGITGKPQKQDVNKVAKNKILAASYSDTTAAGDSARKIIATNFEPLISIHRSTFESVILVHIRDSSPHIGRLIYRSSDLAIDEEIRIDSLFRETTAFSFPVIQDINIQAVDYKLFLFPFRIQHQKFLLGGFITKQEYKVHTQSFPVDSLVTLGILLITVLLSLPFLKVYLIGPQENISAPDVRYVIAMVYCVPFFFMLVGTALWLQYTSNIKSKPELELIHNTVKESFYHEIDQCISQLKYYDHIYQNKDAGFNNLIRNIDKNALQQSKVAFADAYLHPAIYKNLDGVFWVDKNGDEIAKWNFVNNYPQFNHKADREYFKDIKNNAGYRLPEGKDTFSIQPTLAKSTGDYTISIAIKSSSVFDKDTSISIGLYGKMYSVYHPVMPKGYNFCIIDAGGRVLYHSETERSLQENLFDETNGNDAIRIAVSHRDSLMLDDVRLYEDNVKLLMKPMQGLPYFLVAYSNNKVDFLYRLHIIAFSFFCESLLLIMVGLLTLFYYHSNNRFSKLFFSQNDLDFVKPSSQKKEYYKKILCYQLAIFFLMSIAFLFFNGKEWLSYVLYTSILMPVFSVIGYYLIRAIENHNDTLYEAVNTGDKAAQLRALSVQTQTSNSLANTPGNENDTSRISLKQNLSGKAKTVAELFSNRHFIRTFLKIIVPYLLIILLFFIIKSYVPHSHAPARKFIINLLVFLFALGFPFIAIYLSLFGLPRWLKSGPRPGTESGHSYLRYFVVAIILSAMLTSVMPTIGFMLYAAGQEKSLQLKAGQMHVAEELARKRNDVNYKVATTKLLANNTDTVSVTQDSQFIDSLKFSGSKGVYFPGHSFTKKVEWKFEKRFAYSNSALYKKITQYLFLPVEHSDYFTNSYDYYWTAIPRLRAKKDSLILHHKNLSDNTDPFNVSITSSLPPLPSVFSVFRYFPEGIIIALLALLVVAAFYNIIYSVLVRIFLIDYFDRTPGAEQDTSYLDKNFFQKDNVPEGFDRGFWGRDSLSLEVIINKEKAYDTISQREESILKIQTLLMPIYENIWKSLTPTEQYVLYDFAIDGFTNYKNVDILYSLYKKGIFKKERNQFIIMTDSFRNYLVTKTGTHEINKLKHDVSEGGTWGNVRTVLLILIFGIIVFLFVVQEDVSKRVFAIVTSLGAIIPLLLKLFDRNLSGSTSEGSDKK